MNAILSEKGQVTIPKKIRDELGFVPGSLLNFVEEEGRLVVKKVLKENPISAWKGKGRLPVGHSVNEYLNTIRGGE